MNQTGTWSTTSPRHALRKTGSTATPSNTQSTGAQACERWPSTGRGWAEKSTERASCGLSSRGTRLDNSRFWEDGKRSSMSHEREIAEEQEFLDLALSALDHMRQGARDHFATALPLRTCGAPATSSSATSSWERPCIGWTSSPLATSRSSSDGSTTRPNGHGEGDTYHVGSPRGLGRRPQSARHRLARSRRRSLLSCDRRRAARPLRRRHVAIRAQRGRQR